MYWTRRPHGHGRSCARLELVNGFGHGGNDLGKKWNVDGEAKTIRWEQGRQQGLTKGTRKPRTDGGELQWRTTVTFRRGGVTEEEGGREGVFTNRKLTKGTGKGSERQR
jgi:hypothetical protein